MKPAGLIARGAYDDDAERTRKTVCRQCKTVCRGIRRCLLREMLPRRRHIQVFRVLCEGKIHHPSRWAENCCSWDSGPCWSAVLVPFTSRPLSPCCCSQAMRWPRSPTLCACMRAGVCVPLSAPRTLLSQHGGAWQPPTIIFCARAAHLRCRMRSSCAVQERGANASQARRTHPDALGGGAGLGFGVRGCAGEQSK